MRKYFPYLIAFLSVSGPACTQSLPSLLITHIQLIDGTGIPARSASVRLRGNRITAVGNLTPLPDEEILDGNGWVLAPGFIDTHSHLAGAFAEDPGALAAVSQGITTIISGQDGESDFIDTLAANIKTNPVAINVATYTGHTWLREWAMGTSNLNRPATAEEIKKMKDRLRSELRKGSLGLSTGLEYAGAYFAGKDEVLQLAMTTAEEHGRYISHIRSEDIDFTAAIDEIIAIGRQARLPIQISHIKIALKDDWGTSAALLAKLETARMTGVDITADCYPYEYWYSTLKVLFPKTDYTNATSAQFAVDHTFDPARSILVHFAPQPAYKGRTITEIAAIRSQTPAQTLMGLIAEADTWQRQHPDSSNVEGIMAASMSDGDICNFLAWPHTNICSDGSNGGHPRGYGTFTRVLGHYTREKKIMSWETAINKMTALSAEHCGIRERGIIAPGYIADMVLLDPEKVKDNADIANPRALSDGIEKVWVNGTCVYNDHKTTRQYPGLFIRK